MTLPTRRHYSNASPQLTLASSMTASSTQAVVATNFTGWPATPFYGTLDIGTASAEIVLVTAVSGPIATIGTGRGQDGTTAVSHAAGATFDFTVVAKDLDEANAHTSASTGVHGVAGSVVGTTDTQTLTGKTLTSPTITTPAISGATLTGTTSLAATTLAGDIDNTAGKKFTGNPALIGQASGVAAKTLSLRSSTGTEKASADDAGNLTVVSVIGLLKPTPYANAAARDAAITTPTDGMVVWLADTHQLCVYQTGTGWALVPAGTVAGSGALRAMTLDPGAAPTGGSPGTGIAWYGRILEPGSWSISSISFTVASAVGNVGVAAFRDTGSNAPGTLVAQSAAVAMAGTNVTQTVSLGATITVNSGDWLALATSSTGQVYGVTTPGIPSWRAVQATVAPAAFASNPTVTATARTLALWG